MFNFCSRTNLITFDIFYLYYIIIYFMFMFYKGAIYGQNCPIFLYDIISLKFVIFEILQDISNLDSIQIQMNISAKQQK